MEHAGTVEIDLLDVAADDQWRSFHWNQGALQAAVPPGKEAGQPGDGLRLEGDQPVKLMLRQQHLHPAKSIPVFLPVEPGFSDSGHPHRVVPRSVAGTHEIREVLQHRLCFERRVSLLLQLFNVSPV